MVCCTAAEEALMSIDTARLLPSVVVDPTYFNGEEQDEPLAGQDHSLTIANLHYPLYARLRGPNCFVASELRVHRDPQNLRDYREPDVLVALDVPDRVRAAYYLWEERKAPDLVLEVLSPSSAENGDLTEKRRWYQQEGVREYVVIDPTGRYAPEPRLQAWRFRDRAGKALAESVHILPDGDGVLRSAVLPYGWVAQGDWVRVVDAASGDLLPTLWELEPQLREETHARQELQARLQQAEERARSEAEARQRAETELERLRSELERLRREREVQG
jgi:Uma2 family endonuclease